MSNKQTVKEAAMEIELNNLREHSKDLKKLAELIHRKPKVSYSLLKQLTEKYLTNKDQ